MPSCNRMCACWLYRLEKTRAHPGCGHMKPEVGKEGGTAREIEVDKGVEVVVLLVLVLELVLTVEGYLDEVGMDGDVVRRVDLEVTGVSDDEVMGEGVDNESALGGETWCAATSATREEGRGGRGRDGED